MKKIFTLLLVVMFFAPVTVMAAAFVEEPIVAPNGESISTLSNNVTLNTTGDASAYGVVTGHLNGSKIYASTSEDTSIFSKVSDPVTVVAPAGSASDSYTDGTDGWKAL